MLNLTIKNPRPRTLSIYIHIRKKEIFKNAESRLIERVSYVNIIQNGDLEDIDFVRKFYRGDIML